LFQAGLVEIRHRDELIEDPGIGHEAQTEPALDILGGEKGLCGVIDFVKMDAGAEGGAEFVAVGAEWEAAMHVTLQIGPDALEVSGALVTRR
jgi:hypothetical protein